MIVLTCKKSLFPYHMIFNWHLLDLLFLKITRDKRMSLLPELGCNYFELDVYLIFGANDNKAWYETLFAKLWKLFFWKLTKPMLSLLELRRSCSLPAKIISWQIGSLKDIKERNLSDQKKYFLLKIFISFDRIVYFDLYRNPSHK